MKKYIFILCSFAFTIHSLQAQYYCDKRIEKYEVLNIHDNKLEFYGNAVYATNFFNQLNDLALNGDLQINIVQIGGSHIQAGVLPEQIRKRFENLYESFDGSLGYVFPFSLAKTNVPYHYKCKHYGKWRNAKITTDQLDYKMGIGGIVAYTEDTCANIRIYKNADVSEIGKHKFNKISILHDLNEQSFIPCLEYDSLEVKMIADSSLSASVFYLNQEVDELKFKIKKTHPSQKSFHFYGAYLENCKPGITYSGIGINGAATDSYLKISNFEEQMCVISPDLVIFSIGVNDAANSNFTQIEYEANYTKICNKIRTVNPACMFIFTTNSDFYHYSGKHNNKAKIVYQAMRNLAKKYNAAVWNMHKVMGGDKSVNAWKYHGLAKKDRIHLTREGYQLIGDLFFDAFEDAYANFNLMNNSKKNGLD